jgi:hypothetical protein
MTGGDTFFGVRRTAEGIDEEVVGRHRTMDRGGEDGVGIWRGATGGGRSDRRYC